MHEAIEQNLWIFGAEFALLSGNQALRTILPKALVSQFPEQKDGKKRPDLLLLNRYKGRHLLIEFKRPITDAIRATHHRNDVLAERNTAAPLRNKLSKYATHMA